MVSLDVSRLPPAAALLLLSSVFTLTDASILLPRQTAVIALRTLDVVNWPLATPAPWLDGLQRRQDTSTNTVCGYIGADPNLPATCSAGSHCAMDANVSAIGCCPNGVACTTGVYTGCVDQSSPTQAVSDPYVFTCQGSNVCYRNTFSGGAFQYGCGSTTEGQTVAATATGLSTTVSITHISGLITRAQTSSSSSSSTSSSSSSTTSSSSSSSSTSSSSTTSSASSTASETASSTETEKPATSSAAGPPPGAAEGLRRNGAIIGGTIAGAAIFVAIISVAIWMRKRKGRNQRMGPGLGKGPSYVGPVTNPKDFAPVPGQEMFDNAGYGHPSMMPGAHGTTTSISGGRGVNTPAGSSTNGYHPGAAISSGGAAADEVPLTHQNEMEEFQRGFSDAIGRGGADDGARLGSAGGASTATAATGNGYGAGAPVSSGGGDITDERPLWQQNRRQSRNLMWM
ncbi:hypothetical protein CPLU01_13560 [Colletotrichum plurivorum]|uniref:Mid2 domain-containing protein n=1 Tax=Colletotrichum plurivorum TaxID=2175906 RepID=A0A8H6JRK0_9PEZI|nr:hypothetical protein CPLU01_13560 [Colletotrichum plurivorum]